MPESISNTPSCTSNTRTHHTQVSIYPIVVRGFVEGVVGMVQDITSRKREDQRKALLARASQVFASSLDLEVTLKGISAVFVPEIADWASVYIWRDDGTVELAAVTHADPSKETSIRRLFDQAPPRHWRAWLEDGARRSGPRELVEDLDQDLDEVASKETSGSEREWSARARQAGTTTILSVPM